MYKQEMNATKNQLKEIDAQILEISSFLDYQRYLTPTNFASENQTFLECYNKGIQYNPQYKYDKFSVSVDIEDSVKIIVQKLQKHQEGIGYILYKAAKSLVKEIELYKAIGDDIRFSELCNELYGIPDQGLLKCAVEILDNTVVCVEENRLYTSEELREIFKKRLQQYNFEWDITISSEMAARVSVEPEKKKVYIKMGSLFTENDVLRLQKHEIDTHILRRENGAKRGYTILSLGTAGSLIHEEGLALYNEFKSGFQDAAVLRLYAARFIACCNIHKSFYELFDLLVKKGCDQQQAMYVVSRIKRGLSDTLKPGGFIKDYVYFQGFYEIKEFLEANVECYPFLYYGAISLSDLNKMYQEIEKELALDNILLPNPFVSK